MIFLNNCIQVSAQINLFNDLPRIYFGSDVFLPGLQESQDFKLSISNSVFAKQSIINYNLAYAPVSNFGIKVKLRNRGNKNRSNVSKIFYKVNEFSLAVGYFSSGVTENAFYVDTYLSYNYAILKGEELTIVGENSYWLPFIKTNLDRVNYDIGIHKELGKVAFSYNLRFTLVNFLNFKQYDNNPEILESQEFAIQHDPFLAMESNFKYSYQTRIFDFYLKINDVFGNNLLPNNRFEYSKIVYNGSLTLGVNVNLDYIFGMN